MQTTSTDYKLEIKKPSRSFECKITIGNNIYTNDDIVDIILETIQPGEGFSIGNTPSQTLDLTLVNRGDTIYSTSQVKVEVGLKIGATIENILMGLFNIDDIEKTDYTTKFTCYDNMIRFETPYFSSLTYPASLQQVVNELATKTGVQFTGSLPAYTVKKLEGFTCREILGYVSSLCGGNALITRDGKFTIVTPKDIDHSITPDNYIDYKREEVKYKIGKVSCKVGDKELNKGSLGTDSMEVKFENPWVTDSILNDIYTKLNGFEYLGYTMKWQGDISLDVGDIVTCTDIKGAVRKIPILSQKFTYNGGLTAEIGAKGETKNKNSFNSSGSGSNKLDRVVTELLIVNEALINKANIQDLEAVSIRTQTIEAKTAAIEVAIIDVAHVSDLTAINANIEKLIAADATMGQAIIGKANIADLNAANGKINILESSIGDIQTLVNGNLTSNNIQSLILSSDKVTVVNGFIKNAMIESLDVGKINAGDISVNKFRIKSDSGNLLIFDNTIQIKDSTRVRVQIGKDASNDYSMYVWDSSGKLMFDATGLKADGIKQKIIRDDMVSDNANISGDKLNISSVVTSINNGAATLKSSKVHIDGTAQTLDVAFNTLTTKVDSAPPSIITDNSITQLDGAIDGMLKINSISGNTLQNLFKPSATIAGSDSLGYWYFGNTHPLSDLSGKTVSLINPTSREVNYNVATISTNTKVYILTVPPFSSITKILETDRKITALVVEKSDGWTEENKTELKGMILEGDWSNKEIPYFEGIRSVGETGENLEVISCGKNLFKLPTNITGGAVLIDGGIRFNKATGRTVSIKLPHALKPNKQYTISYKEKGNNIYPFSLKFFNETSSVEIQTILNNGYRTLITKNVAMVKVYMFISTSEADNVEVDITNIQIEEGTTPTPREPYKEHRQPITLTNSLRGLPNGVRDTVDFERGVVVRNVGKVLLDDNVANYSVHTTTDTLIQFRIEALKNKRLHLPVTPVICTHFNYYGNHSLTPSREGIYAINSEDITYSGICYIAIEKSKLKTLDVAGFVQWLQSNPVTVYYQLATPIEEPIDVEQYMKQFKDGYFLTEGSLINPTVDLTYSTSLASATSMMKEVTESNTTALNIQQGKISALISNTTIVKDGQTIQLKDSYNSTVATVNSINSVIGSHTSSIDALTGQVLAVDAKTNSVRRDLDGTIEIVSQTTTTANSALSKALEVQKTADGFLQRVSNIETNYATTVAMNSAISQNANSIKLEVSKDFVSKNDALNTYATKSSLIQTEDSIIAKFTSTGGYNLLRNSMFGNTDTYGWSMYKFTKYTANPTVFTPYKGSIALALMSATYGYFYQVIDDQVVRNSEYTFSATTWWESNISKATMRIIYYNGSTYVGEDAIPLINSRERKSYTFTTKDLAFTKAEFRIYSYNDTSATGSIVTVIEKPCLCKGDIAVWNPHPSELIDGSTRIDANGVTIMNGALDIKNKAGYSVLKGDSNGDLVIGGTSASGSLIVKSPTGAIIGTFNKDGVDLTDTGLRITSSYSGVENNMYISGKGVTFNESNIVFGGTCDTGQGGSYYSTGRIKFIPTSNSSFGQGIIRHEGSVHEFIGNISATGSINPYNSIISRGTFNRGAWSAPTFGALTQMLDNTRNQHSVIVGRTVNGIRKYGLDMYDTEGTDGSFRMQSGSHIFVLNMSGSHQLSGSLSVASGLSVNGDINVSNGYLKVGGKNFRGWGFSSGNVYYLGLSGDDKYIRMYNNDISVMNGISYLGSPSGRFIKLYSTQAVDVSSDIRRKTNILTYDEKIESFYDKLKPISYELINGHSGRKHYGFIAQEVESAMNEVGLEYKDMALLQKAPMDAQGNEIDPTTIVDYSTDERIVDYEYSLAYTEMISINTHMIQKLRAEITQLKNEISEIKGLG